MGEFTTRDGCAIRYRDTGAGDQVLVLLHGWSQSQAMFDRLRALIDTELRVISYDMRGHGESGRTDNGARVASLATDLLELLNHLGIATAHMLGHSMGASVLWSHIDLYGTSRIRSLVIADQPSACVSLPWMGSAEAGAAGVLLDVAGAATFAEGLLGSGSDAARHAFLLSMLTPDIPDADVAWLYKENLKLSFPFGVRLLIDHVTQDWRDVLHRIDVPTLVTGGEVSHVASSSQEWTASQIPGARLRVFSRAEGGGHFPFFESPGTFAPVLLTFLRSAGHSTG